MVTLSYSFSPAAELRSGAWSKWRRYRRLSSQVQAPMTSLALTFFNSATSSSRFWVLVLRACRALNSASVAAVLALTVSLYRLNAAIVSALP